MRTTSVENRDIRRQVESAFRSSVRSFSCAVAQMPTTVAYGPSSLQLIPPPSASPLGQKRFANSSSMMATELGAK